MDFTTWVDWRSSAKATEEDPGFTRYSEHLSLHVLDRFVTGSLGVSYETLSNGTTNTAISWQHQQDFSLSSHLNANVDYETSTARPANDVLQPVHGARRDLVAGEFPAGDRGRNLASAAPRSSIRGERDRSACSPR